MLNWTLVPNFKFFCKYDKKCVLLEGSRLERSTELVEDVILLSSREDFMLKQSLVSLRWEKWKKISEMPGLERCLVKFLAL